MSSESSTESYPAFARIGLRENPGENLNQITCPDRESNPGHLVSRPDALTVTPQVWTHGMKEEEKSIVKWIPAASGQGSAEPTLSSFVVLILAMLLVIGGVELNPGPVESVKCGVCRNNLRTGLLCITCSTWFHFSCQKLKRDQHIEENWRCRECMRDIAVETTDTRGDCRQESEEVVRSGVTRE
ncbi:hypothetical protein ANN_10747 [Periplaneta americana]|uniref:Zinc finger PHD-type domain-containing protein n=1 Tax=Periplaneta americana TaxID=6978 RepID=A0ABQ8T4T6_PERAM|nr:hypothetical protein ANN_10747 [Periplaneta americana]